MINKTIRFCIYNPFLTILFFLVSIVWGIIVLFHTPVDAIPDLSENQVIIMTQWPGQSPKNIEDQITYPLTVSMQGLPGVRDIRAMSQLWISMVTVIFEDDIDIYFARNRIIERLSLVSAQLPQWVNPVLWPDATGLGQVFMYTLESKNHTLTELRSLQDFTVWYALQSVPGVAEVAPVWGYMKTYQVILDPIKLEQYGVWISEIISILQKSSNNVSGRVVDTGKREIAVQGLGFFENIHDIANTVIRLRDDSIALRIADIGDVREWWMFRRGILADDKKEKVGGIVVMRYGENPLAVIEKVKEKIEEVEKTLPSWVTIESFYDRTTLIEGAINTLKSVLTQELIITAIILVLFLWHFWSTLITTISLLIGVLFTFIFMYLFGIPSNIMSLWGIAIAIGTMVDSAIVISENAYRRLLEAKVQSIKDRIQIITEASLEVGKPIVFAIFIIILSFIPIFSLQWMEGKLFAPLAFTNTFAMFGALIAALFLVPLLCVFFLKGKLRDDHEIPIVRFLQKIYKPLLLGALKFRKMTLSIMSGLFLIGMALATQIGSEFMPPLDEWAIMYMPMTVPDVSERQAQELLLQTNSILAEFPEVEKVVGKAGRASTATDPAPLAMLETFITLKPKSEWREGITKSRLIGEMNRAIRIEKLWNGFTQPIIGRIDMLSTGIRAEVGIKIFGDDPVKLEEIAIEIEKLMSNFSWASWVAAIRTTGLKYLDIHLQDDLLAQYGVSKMDALQMISAGVWGQRIGTTIQWRESYGIDVRLQQTFRQDIEDVKSLPLQGKNGSRVLLDSVADIELIDWPAVINSENGVIRSAVQMNVVGKDLVSFVEEGQEYVKNNVVLPEGYSIEWAGQYENQLRAKARLSWIVPTVLLIIFVILYLTYKDIGLVSIVMLSIPLSLIWWIVSLFIADFNFSVAVWVGFIALFGNAVETGVVIIVYLENAFRKKFWLPLIEEDREQNVNITITKEGIYESVIEWAMLRLRPVLMTAFTSIIGLVPMLTSTGIGAEVQKPLAIVVVWWLTTSVILTLIVLPILFSYLREKQIPKYNKS